MNAVLLSTCPQCREPFEHASKQRVFCSDACRRKASYARRADGERARDRSRLRHDADYSIRAKQRLRAWAEAHRNVRGANAWLAGSPPYGTHLPGVSTPIEIHPVPRWPIELRNTRGLHGAITSVLGLGHDPHEPYWALRLWRSGWAVHWLHPTGAERYVCTTVHAAVYDRPSEIRFGAAVRWRAPRVERRGRQRVCLTTVTPVVIRTDGGASVAERASGASLASWLATEFARRIAPSTLWHQWVRERVRVEVVSNDTHLTSVPLGDKYGIVRGWEGSVTLEVNAPARWLLEAASRIGLGSRIAFGFGCVGIEVRP